MKKIYMSAYRCVTMNFLHSNHKIIKLGIDLWYISTVLIF